MKVPSHPRRLSRLLLLPLTLSLLSCGEGEQIRSYTVAKETAAPAAVVGEPTDRMLAAILPVNGQTWFFKVVGPVEAIEKREDEINTFFASIRPSDDGDVKWDLPEGWKEEPASGFRKATIWVPFDDKRLELTVSGAAGTILANVNRWRGQMQLPEIGASQLADVTREVKAGDEKISIVDLKGRYSDSGMTAPFAGAAQPLARDSTGSLPPGHPPIDVVGDRTQSRSSADVPKFEAPADWQLGPTTEFRKVAFTVGDAERKALVTVSSFPTSAGPSIADPLQNINRWRGEIGLGEIPQDELESISEEIEVDGQPATYAAMIPDANHSPESEIREATLAAMVISDDQVWFFKMRGDRELVAAQQDQFKAFLKSVRFNDAGARDGDD